MRAEQAVAPVSARQRWMNLAVAALFVVAACASFWEDAASGNPWWTSRGVSGLLFAGYWALNLWRPPAGRGWRSDRLFVAQLLLVISAVAWLFVRARFRLHTGMG